MLVHAPNSWVSFMVSLQNSAVGIGVGPGVGAAVGAGVGEAVGVDVGEGVGAGVGPGVGAGVGDVGLGVGIANDRTTRRYPLSDVQMPGSIFMLQHS